MNSGPREWDADTYDTVSDPQFEWGMEVLARLELRGDESVIDAGCGSARITAELLERIPDGRLLAVDGSPAMIEKAGRRLGGDAECLVADLTELELPEPVDLVFSTATFHWILDHDRLFERIRAALKPGGRLVAQCGGEGNIAAFSRAVDAVAARPEFDLAVGGSEEHWNFATPTATEQRLRAAGFSEARCWLQPKPVRPEDAIGFISTSVIGTHLARLPEDRRRPFADAVLEEAGEPLTLEYVRLNIEART
jgi:trans-aconitate 2-methyltransferase